MTEHTYRTFILSDKVTVEQVTFKKPLRHNRCSGFILI